MRDPDKVHQDYSVKQQALVDGIIDELHRRTLSVKDYNKTFGRLALLLLQHLTNQRITTKDRLVLIMYSEQIWEPIQDFLAKRKPHELFMAERRYLMFKIFERVFALVSASIVGDYQCAEPPLSKK